MIEQIGFIVKPFFSKTPIDPTNCFYAQMPFEKMRIDFALPTARLALEIDGEYWHGSRMRVLTQIQMKRQLDDLTKTQKLLQRRWKLLKIVDSDLKRDKFQNSLQKRIWEMMVI